MTGNSFGKIFKFTTWGESHGKAIGCVVDGAPSNIEIDEEFIQNFLDKRKPGQSKFTTQRKEPDHVQILSGVFEGKTTGAPISLMIENQDAKSKDYSDIKDKFRPGHAEFTYFEKYGHYDYRGGGRSSARETAMRVAAGAIARKILGDNVKITAYVSQIGDVEINEDNMDLNEINNNSFFSPDKEIVPKWEELLTKIRKRGSSTGAIVKVIVSGIPAGLGEPVYDKLDAIIAHGLMGINAVKGVEIGLGFKSAEAYGEDSADEIVIKGGKPHFLSNNSGGVLGGISTGQDIIAKVVFKPTSSILIPRKTIDKDYNETDIITKGRHDPCVGIRGVPVVEAMMACLLADLLMISRSKAN